MTPDDARLLTELKELETRVVRLEKKVRTAGTSTSSTTSTSSEAVYRTTLAASASDSTLHYAFTQLPHVSGASKDQWDSTSQEVAQARKRLSLAKSYASLSLRLEAMESALAAQGITIQDAEGNSVTGVTSLEIAGSTVSGTSPDALVTVTTPPTANWTGIIPADVQTIHIENGFVVGYTTTDGSTVGQ